MVVRSQAVLGGWLQSTTANHLATAAEAANLGSAEAAKMPLSHKEGFAGGVLLAGLNLRLGFDKIGVDPMLTRT
jgi:hypothetical protein